MARSVSFNFSEALTAVRNQALTAATTVWSNRTVRMVSSGSAMACGASMMLAGLALGVKSVFARGLPALAMGITGAFLPIAIWHSLPVGNMTFVSPKTLEAAFDLLKGAILIKSGESLIQIFFSTDRY